MSHDDHDDGLVHSHGWATEPPPAMSGMRRRHAGAGNAFPTTRPADEPFDDGLVHSHGWACGERGRQAHG